MITKNQTKYYSSLKNKKFRDNSQSFLAEGEKTVHEFLSEKKGRLNLKTLIATESFLESRESLLQNIEIIVASEKELKKISSLSTPNKAILEIEKPDTSIRKTEIQNELSLFYEDIRDPGNLGTIIRTADWFGIKNIICSHHSVDFFNPKVIQSTMGAINRVKVFTSDPFDLTERSEEWKTKLSFTGTILSGKDIYTSDLPQPGIIFFGNESRGLTPGLIKKMDLLVSIPGAVSRGTESLNVAISTAIVCSEYRRKNPYSK